jgi:hypothetical protein
MKSRIPRMKKLNGTIVNTIIRNNTKLEIDIYRKPTTTNTTINYESNHPTEHKTAAYRQYIKRIQSLPLTTERRNTEWMTIKTIEKTTISQTMS